ncbi:putative F-box/FBD/LRR-repeat protein At5g44950 [Triticum urartu]|uniref:putative F-box/FBD/LRR-repeat protein At5g44950 n=1 Tax=Triticum urartu TaxID=4572 RepID=UPI002043DF8D|nr:putative F-box/FBD/LRR-repeat protein At5g44950 [Triticum urartu]
MEMEAATPIPKKRRSEVPGSNQPEEISSHEPAAAAMEAPESDIRESPTPGAGGAEDGVGHISGLPDAVLGDIISLLPTAEGARTQTLASRWWRRLWRSAPLNLDYYDLPAEGDVLIRLISQILSADAGSGRQLCISAHHLYHHAATVDAWLRSAGLSNLQELEFCCAGYRPVLPAATASTFRLSSSLRLATFSQCRFPDSIIQVLHFPQLKQLTLGEVGISEGSLQSVIVGCPVLESMLLSHCIGFSCIRVCSPNLRTIGVRVGYRSKLVGISIEDAPCLQRLLQLGLTRGLDISIISAPNLETVGRLRYDDTYGFSFKGFPTLFPVVAHTVKTLSIVVVPLSVDMVLDLMCCFPCLEKLYIQICSSGRKNLWRRKHQSHIKCLDIRLKKVVLANYRGTLSDVNFAMLFVLNAKMLELLRFEVQGCCDEELIERQRRLLQLGNRASRGARFVFTKNTCLRKLEDIKHVRYLSVADPFEC